MDPLLQRILQLTNAAPRPVTSIGSFPQAITNTIYNKPSTPFGGGASRGSGASGSWSAPVVQRQQRPGGVTPDGSYSVGYNGPGDSNAAELAERARRNRIDSYKAQAGNIRSQAQGTFDNILKAVQAFRDRSKNLHAGAGQEITNRASGILGSNARTARESEGEARAKGRAFGLGDSSKFNLQNKVLSNLASTQGATLARRGEEERSNQNLFQERQDQAQGQENEAGTYLKSANERATSLENAGYDAAEDMYSGALNDIVNYQRSLAQINPLQAGGLKQYTPNFNGITNTLNGVLSGLDGGGAQTNADEMGNPVNPTDVFSLLKRRGLVQG